MVTRVCRSSIAWWIPRRGRWRAAVTEAYHVNAVVRAMDILLAVSELGPSSLATVCAKADISKATGHRLLRSMSVRQVVVQDPDSGFYGLGPGALAIADSLGRGLNGVGMIAKFVLEEMRELSGETAAIHVRVGASWVCVGEVPSPQPLRFMVGVGATAPLGLGSVGRVLMAFLPEREQTALIARIFGVLGPDDPTAWETTKANLDLIVRNGYSITLSENPGANGVSVPIRDGNGRVFSALNITGPDSRLTKDRIEIFIPSMISGAWKIGQLINGSTPDETAEEVSDSEAS